MQPTDDRIVPQPLTGSVCTSVCACASVQVAIVPTLHPVKQESVCVCVRARKTEQELTISTPVVKGEKKQNNQVDDSRGDI